MFWGMAMQTPEMAQATNGDALAPTKPFASNESLLPATRVKVTIDRALMLAQKLLLMDDPENSGTQLTRQLQVLLIQPQNYVGSLSLQGVPDQPAPQYLQSYKAMAGDLPFQRFLVQSGDVRTWKALKRQEKEQEGTNEIRAAFNAYTDVLNFSGDSYQLNVDPATKKSMIRQDKLPELKQVITSDMGLRYLYRNQVITAMDSACAELEFQLSHGKNVVENARDLVDLLTEAQKACNQWFSLIDPKDVQVAMETVLSENEKTL